MYNELPYKTKQFFLAVIKLSIVIGCVYFIYSKLAYNKDITLSEFLQILNKNHVFSFKNVCFLMILTFFNHFFEILKWQILLKHIKVIDLINATRQTLAGITASLITPNKIGDYGAKVAYYRSGLQKKIAFVNLIGHMTQMAVTSVFGILGLGLMAFHFKIEIDLFKIFQLITLLVIIFGFTFWMLRNKILSIKGFSINSILEFLSSIPKSHLIINVLLAILRYIVFASQFWFILKLFGVNLSFHYAFMGITSMYFLASVVPTLSLFDVVLKTSAGIYVFGVLGVNILTITATTTLMWILNFVIPSMFGSYFILNFKFPQQSSE